MTSTRPPFAGTAVVETLRSRTSLSRQGPCLFDVGFPPLGPQVRIYTSGLLCMPVAPELARFAGSNSGAPPQTPSKSNHSQGYLDQQKNLFNPF